MAVAAPPFAGLTPAAIQFLADRIECFLAALP
jgi:hypothetical protein